MKLPILRMAMLSMIVLLTVSACGSSPTRQQAQQMRLARQADLNYQDSKYAVAKKQYQTLLEANPKFAMGHVRLGVIAYLEGDIDQARVQFNEALKVEPRNAQATYNLAMLHLNDARALLGEYLIFDPQAPQRDPVLVLLAQLKTFGDKQ